MHISLMNCDKLDITVGNVVTAVVV